MSLREQIAETIHFGGKFEGIIGRGDKADALRYWGIAAEEILSLFKQEIEKLENKPSQYHYTCWASGAVKVRDEWGDKETYKCHSFDGDFNCGYRGCKTGIIKGDKELTPIEMHENWMLQKILRVLEG